ncbi:hypothetical protein KSP40_PGU022441 [Platanthera guangdongensis]|uniref:Fungal lipase-type domain-containing protein n=1 Tax=Platanthera guangdongensis TaxID=2320717 RepID=A0ABR2N5Z9_9ASPA
MTCATVGLPATSPAAAARDDELAGRIGMRRSRSEPLLLSSLKVSQSTPPPRLRTSQSIGAFRFGIAGSILPSSIRSLIFETEEVAGEAMAFVEENTSNKGANWVQMICEVRSRWRDQQAKEEDDEKEDAKWEDCQCGVSYESEEEVEKEKAEWDREAFGRLLNRSSWGETKLFSQLAFLCNRAYVIPDIKAEELSHYGLRLVTSSLEKKQMAAIKVKLEEKSNYSLTGLAWPKREPEVPIRSARSSSMAYELAASAASYIHRRAKGLLSPKPEPAVLLEDNQIEDVAAHQGEGRTYKSKMATYVAASSVTAVVAGVEKAKVDAARDLQSLHSSPCEWFLCEEPSTYTRCFVIQGSDSLASWQANLFFEPTEFEETAALVHRGIYEAAKGIYEQALPEINAHIAAHGDRARFRFTGHSLGGSLSVLISLMLLARNAVSRSALHPVVTFGSPAVLCGGHRALRALHLDETFIRAVMMHRDIVPRAFSCNYPGHVAHFLKRISSSFRSTPASTRTSCSTLRWEPNTFSSPTRGTRRRTRYFRPAPPCTLWVTEAPSGHF